AALRLEDGEIVPFVLGEEPLDGDRASVGERGGDSRGAIHDVEVRDDPTVLRDEEARGRSRFSIAVVELVQQQDGGRDLRGELGDGEQRLVSRRCRRLGRGGGAAEGRERQQATESPEPERPVRHGSTISSRPSNPYLAETSPPRRGPGVVRR